MRRTPAASVAFVILWAVPTPAGAQGSQEPRVYLAAGAGKADPLHSDLEFNAATWHVGVTTTVSRRLSVEVNYSEWRHTNERVTTDIPVQNFSGPAGRIGRLAQKTSYVTRTAGVNALLRGTAGRVALWGGGGPAWMLFRRDYEQTESECIGIRLCDGFTNSHTANSLAVQAAAGLDVPIARRLAFFGQYSVAIPTQDPGSGHVAVTGGIRIGF